MLPLPCSAGAIGKRAAEAVLVLGLAALAGGPLHAAAGRDQGRCLQSCNATRPACRYECSGPEGDCAELFPDDPPAQQACELACEQACDDAWDECRLVCENIKLPVTPEEP
jgi:hypothetical protein